MKKLSRKMPLPVVVWEPVPDFCTPKNLQLCFNAAKLVSVISPNHVELAAFFGDPPDKALERIEHYCQRFIDSGIGEDMIGYIVVRCGKDGCYVASRKGAQWIPAYHNSAGKVVDPTGGGNAFLGGLAVALARGKGMKEGCVWGSVAASFAIEQIGMPKLEDGGEGEIWNGEGVWGRVDTLMKRVKE